LKDGDVGNGSSLVEWMELWRWADEHVWRVVAGGRLWQLVMEALEACSDSALRLVVRGGALE